MMVKLAKSTIIHSGSCSLVPSYQQELPKPSDLAVARAFFRKDLGTRVARPRQGVGHGMPCGTVQHERSSEDVQGRHIAQKERKNKVIRRKYYTLL